MAAREGSSGWLVLDNCMAAEKSGGQLDDGPRRDSDQFSIRLNGFP